MLQLTYTGPDALSWREAPAPRLGSDAAALVRPVAVATCDLDALIIGGTSPFPPPFAIGHECVAEVLEVGDAVGSVQPGQLVSVPFQISCGECPACRQGRTSNCSGVAFMSSYGFGPAVEQWGGFLSDVVCVPCAEHMLVPLPDGLEPAAVASASDNISDAWRAVGPALAEHPGADVLVVGGAGPGSIGLYAAGLAVALGVGVGAVRGRGGVPASDGGEAGGPDARRDTTACRPVRDHGRCERRPARASHWRCARQPPTASARAPRSTSASSRRCRCWRCTRRASRSGRVAPTRVAAMPHVLELAASGALRPELVTTRVVALERRRAGVAREGLDEARDRALRPNARWQARAHLRVSAGLGLDDRALERRVAVVQHGLAV